MTMRRRNLIAATSAIGAWTLLSVSTAFAHGGMASPDELGQPLAISGAIAFACYWVVVLWPSRKRNDPAQNNRRKPTRKRSRIANGNGDRPAVSLKAVGRGSDG
jgi:hypothetical protein